MPPLVAFLPLELATEVQPVIWPSSEESLLFARFFVEIFFRVVFGEGEGTMSKLKGSK